MLRRNEQALRLLEPFIKQLSDDPGAMELYGILKLVAGQADEALAALRTAFERGEPTARLLLNLGTAAYRAGDVRTQRAATKQFLNGFPLYVADGKASQTATIGVAKWADRPIRSRNVADFHYPRNLIAQLARLHQDRYRIVSVLFNSPRALQAMHDAPRPDVIYNATVNAEIMQRHGVRDAISTRARIWGAPVINHPDKVSKISRLSAPALYAGLDKWVIPKIERYTKDDDPAGLADRIEEEFDYPMIVRGLVENKGKNMALAENRAKLLDAISNVRARRFFYAIQFFENRQQGGLYRKFRAAIAGDTIQIIRMSIDTNWVVHGGHHKKQMPFVEKYPEFIQQEIDVCRNADEYFGAPILNALQALRSRNPMDVFGVDFDVLADGRLLFFEANASMFLLSDAPPGMPPYPQQAEKAFLAGFDRYLEKLKENY